MADKNVKSRKTKDAASPGDKYRKELKSLLKDVPDEGVLFLIKQAGILIHNAQAEEENRRLLKEAENKTPHKPAVSSSSEMKKTEKPNSKDSKIEVSLEKGAFGKSYILRFGNNGKAFAEAEIVHLLKLVHDSESDSDGCRRIFAWFNRNRKDVLIDADISSIDSPAVKGVYTCLRERLSQDHKPVK